MAAPGWVSACFHPAGGAPAGWNFTSQAGRFAPRAVDKLLKRVMRQTINMHDWPNGMAWAGRQHRLGPFTGLAHLGPIYRLGLLVSANLGMPDVEGASSSPLLGGARWGDRAMLAAMTQCQ